MNQLTCEPTHQPYFFEMRPGGDHLPPDHPDYMQGWYWFFDDGNTDPVYGPFATEETARADVEQRLAENFPNTLRT